MSACTRFPDDAQVLRYVTSDLAEPELSAFEDHLFACDACLARVERYQAAQTVLATRDLPAGPVGVVFPIDDPAATARRWPTWLAAAAAMLVVAVIGGVSLRQAPPPAPQAAVTPDVPGGTDAIASPTRTPRVGTLDLAVLATVTPPPYLAVTTRGEAGSGDAFGSAMVAYARNDWATASQGLAPIETPDARFYKGVSDLMRGDAGEATRALDAVRASGRQPYARESAFYLGKAALLRGDVGAARRHFGEAVANGAATARDARRVLDALDQAR